MTVSTTTAVAAARRIRRRLRPRALHPDFAGVDCAVALRRPSGADLVGGLASCPAAWAAPVIAALALRSLFESAARSLRAVANWPHRSTPSARSLAKPV